MKHPSATFEGTCREKEPNMLDELGLMGKAISFTLRQVDLMIAAPGIENARRAVHENDLRRRYVEQTRDLALPATELPKAG